MRIGLTYDLKDKVPANGSQPEDVLEEYDSQQTVDDLTSAIKSLGHTVVRLGGGREFLETVLHQSVDMVFNISEGLGNYRSREAQVPAVLEMMGIPYTGSDPQCLAICLDKPMTKRLVNIGGVETPKWRTIYNKRQLEEMSWEEFPFPAFVKPAYEGSSKGIRFSSRVETEAKLIDMAGFVLKEYRQPALVEKYIEGDEVTVGIIGNRNPSVLGIMRVLTTDGSAPAAYSLEVKRDWEALVHYECPAQMEKRVLRRIEDCAKRAFKLLGCRDVARIDFRITPEGVPFFLEVNPLPGLNPHSSDMPIMARHVGMSYSQLIASILESAMSRYPLCIGA